MLITTTPTIEGRKILHYRGLVTGETIIGANIFRDILASITDVIGGRSKAYEDALMTARDNAIEEMKNRATLMQANAIVGIDLDYEVFGEGGNNDGLRQRHSRVNRRWHRCTSGLSGPFETDDDLTRPSSADGGKLWG